MHVKFCPYSERIVWKQKSINDYFEIVQKNILMKMDY